jgi:DNA replication initiation complex subunit (GINS family)
MTTGRDPEVEEYLALVEKRKERERAIAEARDAVVEAAQIWYAGDLSDDMSEEEDHLYIAVEALEKLEWSKIVVEITKMAQEDGEYDNREQSSPLCRPSEP